MNVLGSSKYRPWKCGRKVGLIFYIMDFPFVSLIKKSSPYLFSAIVLVGDVGYSYPMGSSKIYGF